MSNGPRTFGQRLAAMRLTERMATDEWQIDLLDLDGYLKRLGVGAPEPGRDALAELHEAHLRAYTFDNIDVLLGQHPGVSLDGIQEKFVGRGRGGYCFEHGTIFSAALERLGYDVRRHWGGWVTQPQAPSRGVPTWWSRWCWTVSGCSATPVRGESAATDPDGGRPEDDSLSGWRYQLRRTHAGNWALPAT